MPVFRLESAVDQVASYLRKELLRGAWGEHMPGGDRVAAELGVGRETAEGALQQLEREGLLVGQGPRRKRRIVLPKDHEEHPQAALRIGLMLWSDGDRALTYIADLEHQLKEAGHLIIDPRKSLLELKMDVTRVAAVVKRTPVDAWIVFAGSFELLEWYAQQKIPTFALFGRHVDLPLAAVRLSDSSAITKTLASLVEHGHRSIVMLVRRQHRLPKPGQVVKAFLESLGAHGIEVSPFNLPDWEETVEGFQKCLTELFRVTPPTALIVDEPLLFTATCHFLAARNIRVPQDVSLISLECTPDFDWCVPAVTHVHCDTSSLVGHVLSWADHVKLGKKDIRQHVIYTDYIPGGTVGPARVKTDA